jgi:hypothetical protein
MIPIGVESDGPIEELLVGVVNLQVVLGGHDIMVILPVLDLPQMLL